MRTWFAKTAPFRASLIVFALTSLLVGAVVFTLDKSDRRSNRQQATTVLAGGARVAASTFTVLRANLRARAGQVAASLDLQRAVIAGDRAELRRVSRARDILVVTGGHAYGSLPPTPRIASTATIAGDGRTLARVTVGLSLADPLTLKTIRDEVPLPAEAALVLVRDGRVVSGGPVGAAANIQAGRLRLGSIELAAEGSPLSVPRMSVVAVEPLQAIDAGETPYRRRLLLAALVTLGLAAALATRLGRPVAKLLNDVTHLTRQAQTDALTGLANRRILDDRLEEELGRARRLGSSLAYVIADIDDFKLVNDRYGHNAGDDVLRAVARVFAESVRELDVAARYGGEEFALVLPGAELGPARHVVERLRKAIAAVVVNGPAGEPISVTASFGAAAYPAFETRDALTEAADAALYDAKRNGKNRVATRTRRSVRPRTPVASQA